MLGELGRFLFRITTETHLFEYLHRIPLVNKNCYLRKAFNEELANKESGQLTKVKLWWALTMCLTSSIFKVLKDEIDKKEHKNRFKFFQERAKDCFIPNLPYNCYCNEKKIFLS